MQLTRRTRPGRPAGAVAVALDSSHTCAVLVGGGVKCWGWNGNGPLGTGDTSSRSSPVTVSLGSGEGGVEGGACWAARGANRLAGVDLMQGSSDAPLGRCGWWGCERDESAGREST